MKIALVLGLGSALFQIVSGLAIPPAEDVTIQLFNKPGARIAGLASDHYSRDIVGSGLEGRAKTTKAKKHCRKGKVARASSSGSEEECPPLPTKEKIKGSFRSNSAFNPGKLLFYSSPPGADAAETYAKEHMPGYSTLIPSFHPEGWQDTWAFEDEIADDFWKLASEAFAELATGTVYAYLPDGEGSAVTWPSKSFWNDELRILQASSAVTKIIRINEKAPHKQSYMKGSA